MHKDIKYEGTDEEKRAKALKDIEQWLGEAKFKEFGDRVRRCQPPATRREFRFALMVGGIQGYPVEVWADELGVAADEVTSGD